MEVNCNCLKLLFISHDATRTGAPILLLRLIEQIRSYSNFKIIILLKNGGELKKDFEKTGKTFVWNHHSPENSFDIGLKDLILKRIGIKRKTEKEKYREEILKQVDGADIIFNNTVTNAKLLKELPLKGKKIFSYFHEMEVITETSCTPDELKYLNAISEKIFVPSLAVKSFLIKDYGLQGSQIVQLKYIIPTPVLNLSSKNREMNRDETRFSVGFCGTIHWRKGYEFVPLIMKKIIIEKGIRDIQFTWIGADKNSTEYCILKHDLQKLNLQKFFNCTTPANSIESSLAQLEVLVLPSREDAFPLVVLEAAHYEVPCIYFSNAGGVSEFSGSDAGIEIDYLDFDTMSEKIIELKKNSELRRSLGRRSKEKILAYSDNKQIVEDLLKYFD
jgi:glycosyltransferase involved in cell wall biosynthesis